MGAFLPVSRGRRALALTGVALLFTTIFMLSSRSEGYRPNIDSAWLTSNIPLSIGNLAAHVPEEVYTAQRNKALAARVVDKEQFSQLEVVLWEEGIHDEVVGAIGNSLYHIGVEPIFDVHFRFSFPDVLKDLVQPDPLIERPVGAEPAINKRLADDSIDILILTTCRFSLEKHYEMIKPSKAHVVCFWHAGNLAPEPSLRKLMHELSLEERITVLVLGNAVQKTMQFKFDEWAEKDANLGWGKLPIDLFVPVFDWPAKSDKVRPAVYPTTVMIQGNLDRYRRGYAKIFEHLEASLIEDASVWGYRAGATPDAPWEPVASGSPLQLQLMGQPVPNMPLEIPEKLSNIVSIHEKLPYPEYYQLLSNADLLLPAFAQSGYYWDTASSSIAAAAIGRVPVLGSRRLWKAYDYLAGPVVVNKEISTPDIEAVHRLRKANDYVMPPDINEQWEAMFDRIRDRNDICWAKIMRRAKKLKHLAY